MGFELGIIFAFAAMLCWGFGDFLIQKSTRKFGDVETLFFISFFGAVVLFPFVFTVIRSFENTNLGIIRGRWFFDRITDRPSQGETNRCKN